MKATTLSRLHFLDAEIGRPNFLDVFLFLIYFLIWGFFKPSTSFAAVLCTASVVSTSFFICSQYTLFAYSGCGWTSALNAYLTSTILTVLKVLLIIISLIILLTFLFFSAKYAVNFSSSSVIAFQSFLSFFSLFCPRSLSYCIFFFFLWHHNNYFCGQFFILSRSFYCLT